MNNYFYELAKRAAQVAAERGLTLDPRFIYCQWSHETGDFSSELANEYYNLGGLTQIQKNDAPQPDGSCYYMQFGSYEDYADYFGKYLTYYEENGIYEADTLEKYITALKNGGYFGDSLENYLIDCQKIYEEDFSEQNIDGEVNMVYKIVTLIRIDDTGIFALPEGVKGEVKTVFADGYEIKFSITENGNIDVVEYDGNALVTAEVG